MYPYDIIPGIGLYEIFYALALICALFVLRILCDKLGFKARLYNFSLFCAVFAIAVGYVSSILFQSWYDYMETGTFRLGTGMTFYGGIIGGILGFLLMYFAVGGRIFKTREHIRALRTMCDIASCCVCAAHAVGRFGCLFAGCCHGKVTDAWYGVYCPELGVKVVPTQLFEALFLIALSALLLYRTMHGKGAVSQYLIAYGVWRFFIEYARADDRGASPIPWLTPSQLTAIVFALAGVAFIVFDAAKKSEKKAGGEA